MTPTEFLNYLNREYELDIWHPSKKAKAPPEFWFGAQEFADSEVPEKGWSQARIDGWLFGFLTVAARYEALMNKLGGKKK